MARGNAAGQAGRRGAQQLGHDPHRTPAAGLQLPQAHEQADLLVGEQDGAVASVEADVALQGQGVVQQVADGHTETLGQPGHGLRGGMPGLPGEDLVQRPHRHPRVPGNLLRGQAPELFDVGQFLCHGQEEHLPQC